MIKDLKIASTILKNEGFVALVKQSYKRKIFPKLKYPAALKGIKSIRNKRFNSVDELINYAFNLASGYIRPQQVKSEITKLAQLIKDEKPKVYMEIGTATGGTLFISSRVLPDDSIIISLDLPDGIHGGGYPEWKMELYESFPLDSQELHLIRGNSHHKSSVEKVKSILNGKEIDFLFIDGDHTYEGVKTDFNLYKELVKEGGLIAFHDVVEHPPETLCNVYDFWKEIENNYETIDLVEDWNQGWAGICLLKNSSK